MPDISLKQLDIDKLWTIVDTQDFEHLNQEFKPYLPEKKGLFQAEAFDTHDLALETALENSTEPLDNYWYIVSLVSLGVLQPYATCFILGAAFTHLVSNYQDNEDQFEEEQKQHIQFFQLQRLRNAAADEMLERLHKNPAYSEYKRLPSYDEPVHDAKPEAPSISEAARAGLKVGIAFFGAYYLSTAWILYEIGLMTAVGVMTGGIGLAIAGAIAGLMAVYCAYEHYKAKQNANLITHEKNTITKMMKGKRDECRDLLTLQKNLAPTFFRPAPASATNQEQFPEREVSRARAAL